MFLFDKYIVSKYAHSMVCPLAVKLNVSTISSSHGVIISKTFPLQLYIYGFLN